MKSMWWDGTGVTSTALRAEVERLGASEGTRTASCIYTETVYDDGDAVVPTKPVCIIGQAIFNLTGKFVPGRLEGVSVNGNGWRELLGECATYRGVDETNSSDDFLFVYTAQYRQDAGSTWGEAVAAAKRRFPTV